MATLYHHLLDQTKRDWLCQETLATAPPKEFIMHILWNEQFFSAPLFLSDGRRVKIASPGTWNMGPGADFQNSHIQIDNEWITGDIEIHRFASDWYAHHHDNDTRYRQVILHVVWDHNQTPLAKSPSLPTLSMQDFLTPQWPDQLTYKNLENYNYSQRISSGLCVYHWSQLTDQEIQEILFTAGCHRLTQKALRLHMLGQASSIDQALYEMMLESFGYHHNKTAFHALACYCDLPKIYSCENDRQRLALLLGTLSLLPDPSLTEVHPELQKDLYQLWQLWWNSGNPVSPVQCSFLGRPFNSPERRIWGAWEFFRLVKWQPHRALMEITKQVKSLKEFYKYFCSLFDTESSWNKWKNFRIPLKTPAQLIGKSRCDDIFINVILPWLVLNRTQIPWFSLENPSGLAKLQENQVLTEAIHRFFYPPTRAKQFLTCAILQQGLMDIYLNICHVYATDCNKCPLSQKII